MRAADHGDSQAFAALCAACNPTDAGLRSLRIADTAGLIERLPILRNLQGSGKNIHIRRADVLKPGSPGQRSGVIRRLQSSARRFRMFDREVPRAPDAERFNHRRQAGEPKYKRAPARGSLAPRFANPVLDIPGTRGSEPDRQHEYGNACGCRKLVWLSVLAPECEDREMPQVNSV